jgi:hypothetical protein
MPIPESQLETWAAQGATATAASTYTSIKAALDAVTWPAGCSPEIYLQGSYRNDTNIYSESDVDVVVEFDCTYKSDVSALPQEQKQAYVDDMQAASYPWQSAYNDAIAGLQRYYGNGRVHPGNKAIQVDTPYRSADVIVAIEHRKYSRYISALNQLYEQGIVVNVPAENRWIVNFPKQHYDNGVAKQGRTTNRYKSTVRMFKNANRYMIANGLIADGVAPSYCIECMVYSAPDDRFVVDRQNTYCNVVNWAHTNWGVIRRVSEQGGIVGTEPGMWQAVACQSYVAALIDLWNNWH